MPSKKDRVGAEPAGAGPAQPGSGSSHGGRGVPASGVESQVQHAILHGRQTVPGVVQLTGKRRVSTISVKGRLLFVTS